MRLQGAFFGALFGFALTCGLAFSRQAEVAAGEEPESPVLKAPAVAAGESGPARFAGVFYRAFDAEAAMEGARFVDRYYRAPGNEGYNATLDKLRRKLGAAGFGEQEGFGLREIESDLRGKAWTPRSASLELLATDGTVEKLHGFSSPEGRDRVMLPINAPSADLEGPVAFDLDGLSAGAVLVTEGDLNGRVLRAARKRGAALVLSSSLNDFGVDPRGQDEHLDAILFCAVSAQVGIPVGKISPRTHKRIVARASAGAPPRVRFRAKVSWSEGPLRTLVATIVGASKPEEAVATAAHVQEPGAGDNASGVAGLAQGACTLAELIQAGELHRPARSIVFIWGDEMRQSAIWLEDTKLQPVAGISADMLGQSFAETGSICLLERSPDPGSLDTLAPDQHTPWGAGQVREEHIIPNGLALIARTAMADVGLVVGGWQTFENPWEGGSDHDVFLGRGVPAILIWHFTDFTYHTGLDRMARLDGEELRRTTTVVFATALAVADLRQGDLERYFASCKLEEEMRSGVALAAERPDVAERWRTWSLGAAEWLRKMCVDCD